MEALDLAEKQPDVVKAMKAQLKSWRESCKASAGGKDYH